MTVTMWIAAGLICIAIGFYLLSTRRTARISYESENPRNETYAEVQEKGSFRSLSSSEVDELVAPFRERVKGIIRDAKRIEKVMHEVTAERYPAAAAINEVIPLIQPARQLKSDFERIELRLTINDEGGRLELEALGDQIRSACLLVLDAARDLDGLVSEDLSRFL